jgi:prolyl-tRNA synthetase
MTPKPMMMMMRYSRLLAPTLRDTPAEAEVVSHQLLMRAGYIRRVASGIYSYLPLWQESGRWQRYGQELMRLTDRHGREACLAATAEEVITSLAHNEIRSYKQLPVNLYQIGNKYRDEIRPRFGLLRGREFIMKDAYSFHASQACLDAEYTRMEQAYTAIFERCGLKTKMVRSDSGAIGGAVSHEFMMLTGNQSDAQQSGENDVVYCDITGYAANSEKAESVVTPASSSLTQPEAWVQHPAHSVLPTPNTTTIEALAEHLHCLPTAILKTLLYRVTLDDTTTVTATNTATATVRTVAVVIRGDYEVEETKLYNTLIQRLGHLSEVRMASEEELITLFSSKKGFIGFPEVLTTAAPTLPATLEAVILDESIRGLRFATVANLQVDVHMVNVSVEVADDSPLWADVRKVNAGDLCVVADAAGVQHPLAITRGIEVGNIFQLGTKYSEAMKATFMNEQGREEPFLMGCYGIGVSRIVASAVERYHDANGILWPTAIAPYQVVVVSANAKDETQRNLAEGLYQQLQTQLGDEVLLDDRDERAGLKFKDADLLGIPLRITVGKRAGEGLVEVKLRAASEAELVAVEAVGDTVNRLLASWDALQWTPSV